MPIKLVSLSCPKCGGDLEMPVESEVFYCKYCGALVYADDDSEKLHIDADISGNITANVNANVNANVSLHDEAAMRRLEMEERRERKEELESYKKRWQKQIRHVLLLIAVLGFFVGFANGDNTKPISYLWGQGMGECFVVILPIATVLLYLRRPSAYERKMGISSGKSVKLNNDALFRKLNEEGKEDYSEYLRQWKIQFAMCSISAVLIVVLARVLVLIERFYCSLASIERCMPLVMLRRALMVPLCSILFIGPIWLFIRRPSKYIQSYVHTMGHDDSGDSGRKR